jgi:hypothetical protein
MLQIICTVIASVASPALLLLLDYLVKDRWERRRRVEDMREFKLLVLKSIITNKGLSYQARFEAYDEYKKLGGNSWVDGYAAKYFKITED